MVALARTVGNRARLPGRNTGRGSSASDLAPQRHHPRDGLSGVAALVALLAARPRLGLLAGVAGDHPEGAGNAGVELDALDSPRGLGADVVVVIGLAANHHPET